MSNVFLRELIHNKKSITEKTNIWFMLFLSFITFGIYIPIWFLRRQNLFNKLSDKEKFGSGPYYLLSIYWISIIFFLFRLSSKNIYSIFSLALMESTFNFIGAILLLVLVFKVRRILYRYYNRHTSGEVSISWFWTFFFHIFYLQYKMNQTPELMKKKGKKLEEEILEDVVEEVREEEKDKAK